MTLPSQATRILALAIVAGALAALTGLIANTGAASSLVPAIAGGLIATLATGLIGWRWFGTPASQAIDPDTLRAAHEEAAQLKASIEALEHAASSLRHDLRGILSPALLTADRLLTSSDPIALRAANATITAVERANQRLSETAPPPAPGAG